ncbi:MAG TPA: PD-(D/E)XK nuclease family protein [Myxococcales bacterium]|nr:PD-(D/E)XK nuclease family protein [Myxococcales bacterium]
MARQLSFAEARRRGPRIAVLPDAARVEERLARLARERGFVPGRVAYSLAELGRELIREAQRAGACPEVASPFALQLALRQAARDHSSGPYFAIRNHAGYPRALGDLSAALTEGLLDPVELAGLDVPQRPAALARTLLAARAALDRAALVDPHRALRLAVDHLERGGALPAELGRASEIEFEGVLDWTPLRLRLATALAARVRVRIRLPWSTGRPELTESLEPVLRAIEKLPEPAPELALFDPADGSALLPFLRRLFATDGPPAETQVTLLDCASPAAQAREIARRCAALIRRGEAPDGIAIAGRSLGSGIAEEIAAALHRLGVPFRERRGRPAMQASPVRLALSILDLADQDFPRESLIELLSSRLLWLADDGDRLPPQALARVLRQSHVRDDATAGGYAAALTALSARLLRQERDAEPVAETARRVQRIINELRRLPAQASLREHGAALLALLAHLGLWRRLRAPEPSDATEALQRAAGVALARDQAAARALEEACAGLARAAARVGEVRLSRAEFAQLLSEALCRASLPGGGARGAAVQLLELRELPGRSFAHLFVAGLVDGELPARPPVDPLLSDDERRAINRAARRPVFRMPAESAEAGLLPPRQAEEPLLFHLALCSAQRSVTLLWPRADSQGRDLLRSPFADEAIRATGQKPEVLPLLAIPAPSACADASELLARAGLDAFADPAYRITPPGDAGTARALAAAVAASPFAARFHRIARAAAAERERVRAFVGEIPPGRFSGQLSGAALDQARATFAFGEQAPLSAHQLEDYATCAFRTLGKRLLRIEVDDRDDTELGPRERGTLLHRCLEKFFRRMGDEGRLPLRGGADEMAALREIAGAEMDAFAEEQHVGHRALWESKRIELLEALVAVVESEREAAPVELERPFGFGDEASWPALRIGDVHVRGIVDRIDRLADGTLLVLDYKSGRLATLAPRLKPEALLAPEFQLALYVEMVRQRYPSARVDAAYVSLREARRTATLRDNGIDPAALPLAAALQERVAGMRSGHFAVRPLSCDYCELKPVCRLVALPTDPEENGGEVPRA